eukprot:gene7843-10469_t
MSPDVNIYDDRRRLELALQAANLGEFEWNAATDTLMISERMSAITGAPAGSHVGQVENLVAAYAKPESVKAFLDYRDTVFRSKPYFDFTLQLNL